MKNQTRDDPASFLDLAGVQDGRQLAELKTGISIAQTAFSHPCQVT